MREDVRAGALRGVPHHQAHLRSGRNFQSRQDCRQPAADRESALRRRLRFARIRTLFSTIRNMAAWAAPSKCAAAWAPAARSSTGTMCPSYMATREEAHTTRGRANVLRLAMTGRLSEAGLDDRGVYDVLDLCLECRACKAECPVGVDMARFKSEFLASYWETYGTPLHAQMLGNVRTIAELGSRIAPLMNWISGTKPVRLLNEAIFGIDRRRTPPQLSRRTLTALVRKRNGDPSTATGVALQRHLHQFLRSGNRRRGVGRDRIGGSQRGARAQPAAAVGR